MNRRLFGTVGVLIVVAMAVGSCKNDPLSDLDGTPATVVTDYSYLQIPLGSSIAVTASVVDARTTPLAVPVTFTPCNASITVEVDTSYHPVPVTSARAVVTADALSTSCVVVAGGGLEDTVDVTTMPTSFNGTISTTTPIVGDTLLLTSSTTLRFDPNSANVEFEEGVEGEILVRTADTLMIRVPQPDRTQPAVVNIKGVVPRYATQLLVSLPSPTAFDVQGVGDRETPGDVVITPPASGGPDLVFYDGFKSGADGATTFIDYFYEFTLAATDTLTFTLEWDTAADLDMLNLRTNFTVIGGGAAATGNNPETYTVIFPAGTYYLLVESFDDHDEVARLFKVTIHNP